MSKDPPFHPSPQESESDKVYIPQVPGNGGVENVNGPDQ